MNDVSATVAVVEGVRLPVGDAVVGSIVPMEGVRLPTDAEAALEEGTTLVEGLT